jgi:choline kinase
LKAIILAAGEGTRLRPLTDHIPKCLVKLFGISLLERQIQIFQSCGVDDIIVVTGYKSEKITFPNVQYIHNSNYDKTNMVETLFCAKNFFTNSIIVAYGDIIFEKQILENLIKSTHDISIVVDKNWEKYWKLRFKNPLDDAESLRINSNNFITNIGQKEKNIENIQGQYIGLMKFQNQGIEDLIKFYTDLKNEYKKSVSTTSPEKLYMTDILQGLLDIGCKMKAIFTQNGWLELDSINDYELYSKMYSENTISNIFNIHN